MTGRSRKTIARLLSRRSLQPPNLLESVATNDRDRVWAAANDPAHAQKAESLRSLRTKRRFARGRRGSPAADPAAGPPIDPASGPATTAPAASRAAAPAEDPAADPIADRAAHGAGPTGGLVLTTSPPCPAALLAAGSAGDGDRPAATREEGEASAPGAHSVETATLPTRGRDGAAPRGRPKAARNGGVREIAMLAPAASAGSRPALLFTGSLTLSLCLRRPAT